MGFMPAIAWLLLVLPAANAENLLIQGATV